MPKDSDKGSNDNIEPTIYVTLVKNGKVTKEELSYAEAEEMGLFSEKAYLLIDTDDPSPVQTSGTVCPHDNYTQREFERTGRLGCAKCYETFQKLIIPLLKRMHKDIKHVGKVPKSQRNEVTLKNRLEHLKKELDSAIKSERYEDAATVRDKIEQVRSEKGKN